MRILTGRHLHIDSLRFSSDGRYLACDGHTPVLRKWFVNVWQVHGAASPKYTIEGQFRRWHGFIANDKRLQLHRGYNTITVSLATGKVVPDALRLATCETSPNGQWVVHFENDSRAGVNRVQAVCRVGRRRVERWTREFPLRPNPTDDIWDVQIEVFDRLKFAVNGTRLLVVFWRHENALSEEAARRVRDGHPVVQEVVRVLDTETGHNVAEWQGERSSLCGPMGHFIYLRGPAFEVRDSANFDQPAITRTNSSREDFTAAAFSPDGRLLATTSNDTTVTMWDTATWEPIRQYGWEIGRLRAVAFAPDGLTCAAGSDTGKVVLFDVDG